MRTRTLNILLVLIIAALPVGIESAEPTPPPGSWQQETYGQWSASEFTQTELTNQWWASVSPLVADPTAGAQAIAAFDADGDGDIDLALGRWEQNQLLLNDGAGNFARAESGDFGNDARYVFTLAVFDADGDGDIDIVTGFGSGPHPHALFLNDGNGVFTRVEAGQLDDTPMQSRALAAFDANGDGHIDLVVSGVIGSTQRPIELYLNDGVGRFTLADPGPLGNTPRTAFALAAVDLDGDGDLDLIVGLDQARDAVYINNGSGQFSPAEAGDFDDDVHDTRALAVFDANLDGHVDIAVGYGGYRERIPNALFLNNGQGRFMRSEAGAFDDEARRSYALVAFDADNDGDLDLAVGRGDDARREPDALFINDGAGRFQQLSTGAIEAAATWTLSLAAFDADGDGDLDLAIGRDLPVTLLRNHWNNATCVILGYLGMAASGGDQLHELTYQATIILSFDANGDGRLDLATASRTSGLSGQIYLNDGAGGFLRSDAGEFSADRWPVQDMIALDIENDGDMDLVIGLYGQGPAHVLYINDGAGRFTRAYAGALTAAQGDTFSLAALDVDGDGDQDVAASGLNGSTAAHRVYLNDGQGFFTVGDGGAFGAGSVVFRDLLPVDLDRDGDADLVATADGAGAIFLNDGQGRFVQVAAPAFASLRSQRVAAFDADGDNDLDLLVSTVVGRFNLLLNDGSTQFTAAPASNLDGVVGVTAWTLLDANRDGRPDIVAGRQNQSGALYLNNGSGVFIQSFSPLFDDFALAIVALAAVDIDGDGNQDLAAASSGPKAVYRNSGQGVLTLFDAGDFSDKGGWNARAIAYLDMDGDGDLDLVVGRQYQRNGAYRNDGAGRFNRFDAGDFDNLAGKATDIAVFDADGDGDLDLVVANGDWPYPLFPYPGVPTEPTSRNALYLNNGSGVFQLVDAGDLDETTQSSQVLAAFDADGDGDIDLAVGNGRRTFSGSADRNQLFLNDGNGHFTLTENEIFANSGGTTVMVAFDADGDGDVDLALQAGNNLRLLVNNGQGQFDWGGGGDLWRSNTVNTRALAAFDVDGDGDIDLVVGNDWHGFGAANRNSIYLNDGAGSFTRLSAGDFPASSAQVQSLAALDFDGDGDLDLAVAAEGSGGVLYLNDGAGVFSRARTDDLARTTRIISLVAFDADGDGDTDLAAGAERENRLFVNRNLYESGSVVTPLITPASVDPRFGVARWTSIQVQESVPAATQLTYDVLNPSGSAIPAFAGMRPDAAGLIDLSGLNAAMVPAIRLRANFADLATGPDFNDRTPQLCVWQVMYQAVERQVRYFPLALRGGATAQ